MKMWRRLTDDAGRLLELPHAPQRIASLVPSVTELVCHLGGSEQLIAATRFCIEPADLPARVARIGGTKTPACEQLLALRPDLVVLNSEENRREDFQLLEAAGVPIFVSFTTTVSGAVASVTRLGHALGLDEVAAALGDEICTARARAVASVHTRRRVFCPIWRKPWMSFNRDTYCHDVLACAGGDNVCSDAAQRYPVVELADIAAADPEVVLLPDEPYPFSERHRAELAELSDTPAGRSNAIHVLDGKALSWYGPRTPAALQIVAEYFAT